MNAARETGTPDAHQRLLEVARDAFARDGYNGTTIRDITAAAEVNLGAVTYHFGSKEALYHSVLMSQIGPLRGRIRWVTHQRVSALDRMERVVRAIFEHIRTHRAMVPIMVREMASGGEVAAPVRQVLGEVIPAIVGMISAGQKDGSIREGDPLLLALSVIALPVYLNLARHALAQVTGFDFHDQESFERVVTHAELTVRRALENR